MFASALGAIAISTLAGSGISTAATAKLARLSPFALAADPAWSPDGSRIAFVASHAAGELSPRSLYVMNVDGTGAAPVTRKGFEASWPSWSPDSRNIAFAHKAQGRTGSDVYAVRADGRGLRRVVSDAAEPAWGPGGKAIAFSRETRRGNLVVFRIAPDGTGPRLVAASPDHCQSYGSPTWSPDGQRVAFSQTGAGYECDERFFIRASRGYAAKGKILARNSFAEPDWAPDGRRLAVASFSTGVGRPERVAVFGLRTHRTRYLGNGWHPRWSPDGRRLVFVRGTYGANARSRIYVMNADGSRLTPITR
jgi:TolB protein